MPLDLFQHCKRRAREFRLMGRKVGRGRDLREIDLVFEAHARSGTANRLSLAGVYCFCEAKNLQHPSAFVGIRGPDWDENSVARRRADFAVAPRINHFFDHMREFSAAFVPLCSKEVCVHWAIVRREKEGKEYPPRAERDKRYSESIQSLVRATLVRTDAWERAILAAQGGPADLRVLLPIVVIDTEDLWSYNPTDQTFQNVDSIQLAQRWEVGGDARSTVVQVVKASAIETLIAQVKEVEGLLRELLKQHGPALFQTFTRLREEAAQELLERQMERLSPR